MFIKLNGVWVSIQDITAVVDGYRIDAAGLWSEDKEFITVILRNHPALNRVTVERGSKSARQLLRLLHTMEYKDEPQKHVR